MNEQYAYEFRTCGTTGLKVHLPAERLFYVNAVTAVVALLVGGVMALLDRTDPLARGASAVGRPFLPIRNRPRIEHAGVLDRF